MLADKATLVRPDGLHLLTRATLAQLADDATLQTFAAGLLARALNPITQPEITALSLAEALHQAGNPRLYPLLAALLVLDAEVSAVIDDEPRLFPLPGFLTYRAHLPLDRFPLNTLRLPPLNPAGHYRLQMSDDGVCSAVRLDLHPTLRIAGHVRLATSSLTRRPARLPAAEQRLDRQIMRAELVGEAILADSRELSAPLTEAERAELINMLREIIKV